MRYCIYCGKPIEDDSIYCIHCGKNVQQAIEASKEDYDPHKAIEEREEPTATPPVADSTKVEAPQVLANEPNEDEEEVYYDEDNSNRKWLWILGVVIIALIGCAVWYFGFHGKNGSSTPASDSAQVSDSLTQNDSIAADSAATSEPEVELNTFSSLKKIMHFNEDDPGGTFLFAGDTPHLKDVRIYIWDSGSGGAFSATYNGERIKGKVKFKETYSEDISPMSDDEEDEEVADDSSLGENSTWNISLIGDSGVLESFTCDSQCFYGSGGFIDVTINKIKTLEYMQVSGYDYNQKLYDAWIK